MDTVRDLFIRRMDGWRELCIWTGTGGREGGVMPLSAKSRRSPRSAFRIRAVCGRAGSAADLAAEHCKLAAQRKKDMRTAIWLIGVRIPFICLKTAFSTKQLESFALKNKTTQDSTNKRTPQTHLLSKDREPPPCLDRSPLLQRDPDAVFGIVGFYLTADVQPRIVSGNVLPVYVDVTIIPQRIDRNHDDRLGIILFGHI